MRIIRKIIEAFFSIFGYNITIKKAMKGIHCILFNIRMTMDDVFEHLIQQGFNPATVIDVGAAFGTDALYINFPGSKHILVEPLKEYEKYLKEICSRYNAEYILAAAASNAGKAEIGVSEDLEGSSLLITDDENIKKREVPLITIDNICKERNVKGPILLKIDVQGFELQVLEGSKSILEDTEVIILEVSFFRFSKGFPDLYDVLCHMKELGFIIYEIFGGHNRPLDGARAQADVVFVKENGRFRKSHSWATPEQIKEYHNSIKKSE